MNVASLDIPLLVACACIIAWARLRGRREHFQFACLLASTIHAQISFGLSWSTGRLAPLLSATGGLERRKAQLGAYVPFALYAVFGSIAAAIFWDIPAGVAPLYGEYRILISIFNLVALFLTTRAMSLALNSATAVHGLWSVLRIAGVVHGLASLYQFVAIRLGLPLVGISRAHGLTAHEAAGDVASFRTTTGEELLRPGGLAGEPKTVAVIFGIVLIGFLVTGFRLDVSGRQRLLTISAAALSAFGLFASFSTSAFVGAAVAVAILAVTVLPGRGLSRMLGVGVLIALVSLPLVYYFISSNPLEFVDLLNQRTVERLDDELDPPVQASLEAISESTAIAIFGTGSGGSSFEIMRRLNLTFQYAFAPNIGLVLLLVEHGLAGTLLFLGAYAACFLVALRRVSRDSTPQRILLIATSVAAMCICLAGSGIPLGFPLAIATLQCAARRSLALKPSLSTSSIDSVGQTASPHPKGPGRIGPELAATVRAVGV